MLIANTKLQGHMVTGSAMTTSETHSCRGRTSDNQCKRRRHTERRQLAWLRAVPGGSCYISRGWGEGARGRVPRTGGRLPGGSPPAMGHAACHNTGDKYHYSLEWNMIMLPCCFADGHFIKLSTGYVEKMKSCCYIYIKIHTRIAWSGTSKYFHDTSLNDTS